MIKTSTITASSVDGKDAELLTPWICRIARLSTRFMGGEMMQLGFGSGQFIFLATLYEEEGISQDELSRRVGVNKSNTSRALLKLEKYGFIRRENSLSNHRIKIVYLEPKARKIEKKFRKIQKQWNTLLIEGFSEETKTELMAALKIISGNAETYLNNGRNYIVELSDIMPLKAWEQFEKSLFDQFHINCTVYNASGMSITGKPNWCNDLCPKIKANKTSLAAICATGNQYFMSQAKKTQEPVIGECDAGLVKIAAPILIDGEFLGTAGGCGLLSEDGEVETFLVQKTSGMAKDEIDERCRTIGKMSEDRAKEMAAFIEKELTRFVHAFEERSSVVTS